MLLRRPATLYEQEGMFVPRNVSLEEVDARFEQICNSNSSVYDGRMLHVLGVHRNGYGGATIHVMECAYRMYAVQTETFDVGVRPLGVKGITTCGGFYLWGKRSSHVHQYKNKWEFVPAGVVEPGQHPDEVIERELSEEVALTPSTTPIQIGIEFDRVTQTWELIYNVTVDSKETHPNKEYAEVKWCNGDELPSGRSSISDVLLKYA